jgi:hypothetical protein
LLKIKNSRHRTSVDLPLILRRFSVDFKLVPRRQAITLLVARTSGPVKSTLSSPFPGFISPSGARACAVLPRYVPISRASRTNKSSMLVRYVCTSKQAKLLRKREAFIYMHMIKKGQMKDFGKVPLSAAQQFYSLVS